MPYITLSDQIKKLHNPQRSDAFVKKLRDAIREGDIDAADTPGRFELPKKFAKRGGETYTRKAKDLIIDGTPEFEAWFAKINKELTPARANGKIKVTPEAIEAGLVDFKVLAAETRRKMGASFEKGQKLGSSRAAGSKGPGRPKKTAQK
ncbi:hypothetical protein [Deinococcus altitudinis]|uniref:hypothetical protein n=1 Tax=Deinococcus altitudinis TaxID=468914 RepID=UPI003892C9BA